MQRNCLFTKQEITDYNNKLDDVTERQKNTLTGMQDLRKQFQEVQNKPEQIIRNQNQSINPFNQPKNSLGTDSDDDNQLSNQNPVFRKK